MALVVRQVYRKVVVGFSFVRCWVWCRSIMSRQMLAGRVDLIICADVTLSQRLLKTFLIAIEMRLLICQSCWRLQWVPLKNKKELSLCETSRLGNRKWAKCSAVRMHNFSAASVCNRQNDLVWVRVYSSRVTVNGQEEGLDSSRSVYEYTKKRRWTPVHFDSKRKALRWWERALKHIQTIKIFELSDWRRGRSYWYINKTKVL